jgi:protein-S-isoprenylcysteine O-methyltransferase Ste14
MGPLFPKAVYFAGLAAETILRIPYERQRQQLAKTDRRVTRTEWSVLAGLFVAVLVLPTIYSLTRWLDFADYRLPPRMQARAGRIGALLLATAVWLFRRSHHDLGANWSPSLEIGARHTLTTHGVYRTIRHPMYASQLLWSLAQALLLHNWIAGCAGFVSFLTLYLVRVPREERMMLDHVGNAYRAYCAQTGRIVPRLHR